MTASPGAADYPLKKPRNMALDFVRGVAIFLVMGNHFYNTQLSNPLLLRIIDCLRNYGWAGVDLFFVLSGFLVGGLLLEEYGAVLDGTRPGVDGRRFLLRRMLKIWPAYYVMILVHAVVRHSPLSTFLWQNLLHVQNYFGSSIGPTWSLAVEEHFYLLLTAGIVWCARRNVPPKKLLLALIGICVFVLLERSITVVLFAPPDVWRWTHTRIDSLTFGVILALTFKFWRPQFEKLAHSTGILLMVVMAGCGFLVLTRNPAFNELLLTVGYTILYLAAAAFILLVYKNSEKLQGWLIYRLVSTVGLYSYGIYLWHVSVGEPIDKLQSHFAVQSQYLLFALLVSKYLAAIALGVVATHAVEWPFLRIRERIWAPSSAAPDLGSAPQHHV